MFDLDHWSEIVTALSRNKLRTFLTAFGVAWGIFMLVIMLGSGKGLENGVSAGFSSSATNSFFMWTRRTSVAYAGLPAGRGFRMNNSDTEAIKQQVKEAGVIAPRAQLGGFQSGNNVVRGQNAGAFNVMGDEPQFVEVQAIDLQQGRFVNPFDIEQKRKVAIIGTRVAEVLFEPDEEILGDHIRINGVIFKVVGVFKSFQEGGQAENEEQTIYIPLSTYQQAFNAGDSIGWYAITAAPGYSASVALEKSLEVLKARHRVAPQDDRAFGNFNLEERYKQTQGLFLGIKVLVWIVGIGTLLAGAIGVSNIMLVIVRERTREIGLRRAIGATPFVVIRQIVLEAIVLTGSAGFIGLVGGVFTLVAINSAIGPSGLAQFKNPSIDFNAALQALGILTVCGVFAGLLPAARAVSIDPTVALHSE